MDWEPRTGALADNRARTVDLLSALPEPNRRWLVFLGQRSVDRRSELLCLIVAVETQDLGTGTPILGPRALGYGPLVLAL